MAALTKGNSLYRVIWIAPALAVGYAIVAYAVHTTGCAPLFADVDFFGVRVTVFLLLALTFAALILIVFAAMNIGRVARVLRRRHRGEEYRPGLAAAAFILAAVAFVITAWLGWIFLQTPCF